MVSSPGVAVQEWEIWLFVTDGEHGPVGECGLFQSREDARHMCSAMELWLRIGNWTDGVLSKLSPRNQTHLFRLRRNIYRRGFSAGDIRVCVKPYGVTGDNQMDPDDDDSDDSDQPDVQDATPLESVDVVYTVEPGGLTETEVMFGRG